MSKWRKSRGGERRWIKRQLIRKHGAYCQVGKHPIEKMKDVTLDHILPRSKGGLDVLDNLQLACYDCNQTKGAMTPEEFQEWWNAA